ncbi:MAG: AtpZ/AtpI family protein [Actinomycetota bacterium]
MSDTGGGRGSNYLVGQGLSLAFEFVGAVFLFWFAGRLVDNWLGIEPWGQVVGAVIGWIGGTLHVYYAVQRRHGR